MKLVTFSTALCLLIVTIECTASTRISDQIQMETKHDEHEIRVRRVPNPGSDGHVRRHKYKKIEIIPADESLRTDEFSEEIEVELGNAGLGKHAGNKRRRLHRNKRACIYIDIPGSNPEEEIDIIYPGSNEIERDQEPTERSSPNAQMLQANEDPNAGNAVDEMGSVYWLKLPPTESVRSREVFGKVYKVVNDFHQSGKDVLFIPIAKGYLDTEEARNGFLKSLQVNPIEREKKTFEIKVL